MNYPPGVSNRDIENHYAEHDEDCECFGCEEEREEMASKEESKMSNKAKQCAEEIYSLIRDLDKSQLQSIIENHYPNIHELVKATNALTPCAADVFQTGTTVCIVAGGSAKLIERFVQELADLSGQKVDWNYVGGRGVVRAIGDIEAVREALSTVQLHFFNH